MTIGKVISVTVLIVVWNYSFVFAHPEQFRRSLTFMETTENVEYSLDLLLKNFRNLPYEDTLKFLKGTLFVDQPFTNYCQMSSAQKLYLCKNILRRKNLWIYYTPELNYECVLLTISWRVSKTEIVQRMPMIPCFPVIETRVSPYGFGKLQTDSPYYIGGFGLTKTVHLFKWEEQKTNLGTSKRPAAIYPEAAVLNIDAEELKNVANYELTAVSQNPLKLRWEGMYGYTDAKSNKISYFKFIDEYEIVNNDHTSVVQN